MFITARLSKKKIICTVLVFLAAAAIILFLPRRTDTPDVPVVRGLGDNEARVAALEDLGWQVDPVPAEEQEVLIPADFPEAYRNYNELQREAGFDLLGYAGRTVMRYSYEVLNYPDYDEPVYADLLISDGVLIGGDIHSLNLDGFMVSLKGAS